MNRDVKRPPELLQYKNMNVAIQGQAGSFHEQAARIWYGDRITIIPCTTFTDVFLAYQEGSADAIITAVENTIYGSINDVYQLIEECEAPIIGEVKLPIDQMLIAHHDATISNITEIYSHPVALAQCRHWLQNHLPHAELIEYFDTAGAVEYIKSQNNPRIAAIASAQAALLYDMPILQRSVQDSGHNVTRFLVLEPLDPPQAANRASLVVTTTHKPGALVEVLQVFANAGVNLAKLQSQPIVDVPWSYKFFMVVDCAGDPLHQLLTSIEASGHSITLLGEYVAD